MHFFQSGGLYTRPDIVDLRSLRSYESETTWVMNHWEDVFRRYVASGVTAVVDVGGPFSKGPCKNESINRDHSRRPQAGWIA